LAYTNTVGRQSPFGQLSAMRYNLLILLTILAPNRFLQGFLLKPKFRAQDT
jgi:hypothetical protein